MEDKAKNKMEIQPEMVDQIITERCDYLTQEMNAVSKHIAEKHPSSSPEERVISCAVSVLTQESATHHVYLRSLQAMIEDLAAKVKKIEQKINQ